MRGRGNVGNVGNVGKKSFLTFPSFLRRIAGMPDYELHLRHLRQCHPEQRVPSEREYFEEYLRTRYQAGPTRCC